MKNESKLKIAMCWKCVESVWVKDEDPIWKKFGAQSFVSCKKDSRINGMNRNDLCPLLK